MGERRYVHELYGHRATTSDDEGLRRLVEHKDRVVALLRAGRRPAAAPGYRSSYAARLWALAHAEWSEGEPTQTVGALDRSETPSSPRLSLVGSSER